MPAPRSSQRTKTTGFRRRPPRPPRRGGRQPPGEPARPAFWLPAPQLDPKATPFDPSTIFDEIQPLVPAYDVPRLNLMPGNDEHLKSELVQIQTGTSRRDLVLPANDTLFTSGTLGEYSDMLHSVMESRKQSPAETAAD